MTIYDQYDEILHKAHQLDAAAEKEAVEHFKLNISSRVSRLKVKSTGIETAGGLLQQGECQGPRNCYCHLLLDASHSF